MSIIDLYWSLPPWKQWVLLLCLVLIAGGIAATVIEHLWYDRDECLPDPETHEYRHARDLANWQRKYREVKAYERD